MMNAIPNLAVSRDAIEVVRRLVDVAASDVGCLQRGGRPVSLVAELGRVEANEPALWSLVVALALVGAERRSD
jgi:hypothetical protein